MKNKKTIKLYNIIFPIWVIWIFPSVLLFILPANFLIDLFVIKISAKIFKCNERIQAKKVIAKVWLFGFTADIIGTIFLGIAGSIISSIYIEFDIYSPFQNLASLTFVIVGILIAAFCIYFFNYKISFKNTNLSNSEKHRISLVLAVFTAPYFYLLPIELLDYL